MNFLERIKVSPEVQERLNLVPKIMQESKERIILAQDAISETKDRIKESKYIIDAERD